MNVNDFISSSDLATFKNDSAGTVFTVTIANGTVFNPSNPILGTQTKSVGTINAGVRAVGTTSKYAGTSVGASLVSDLAINISGVGASVATIYTTLQRVSPTDLKMQVELETVLGSPNYTTTESQTLTFTVNTFLSPFD